VDFIAAHWAAIVGWSTSVSWVFHTYLLFTALVANNSLAKQYENAALIVHEVIILLLLWALYLRREKRRRAPS
jgi:membrane protein DedA with SNARE-associated domain